MKKHLPKILVGVGSCLGLLLIGVYTSAIKFPVTNTMQAQAAYNILDDRELSGISHNIFVGKVVEQVGTEIRNRTPETQFSVDVIYNIKGNLVGSVVVNQEGGYRYGVLYVMHGGDMMAPVDLAGSDQVGLLKPGSTYLFATRSWDQSGPHTMNQFSGAWKLISDDPSLSREALETLAKNDERVKELEVAYPNEVLHQADVASGHMWNSYESIRAEQDVK